MNLTMEQRYVVLILALTDRSGDTGRAFVDLQTTLKCPSYLFVLPDDDSHRDWIENNYKMHLKRKWLEKAVSIEGSNPIACKSQWAYLVHARTPIDH